MDITHPGPEAPGVLRRNAVSIRSPIDPVGTLVFAHGFGTDQDVWSAVAAAFEDRDCLVRFDHVGAGRSDPGAYSPNRYAGLDAYADDLLEVCDAADVRDAVLVAHSMSAMIGVVAATRHPESFSWLVLVGGSVRYRDEPGSGHVGGFDQAALDELYGELQTNYYAWASGIAREMMANPERPGLATAFATTLAAIRPDVALTVLRLVLQEDIRHLLPRVRQPALVIQTRQDPAVPIEAARALAGGLPDSRLVVVDADGHLPHLSAADAVVAAIRGFLVV